MSRGLSPLLATRAVGNQGETEIEHGLQLKGHALEWCEVLPKSFQHFTFEFVSRFHHSVVLLLPAFSLSGFKTIGLIDYTMCRNCVE